MYRYSSQSASSGQAVTSVHSQEIYQLSQYLQEAMHRYIRVISSCIGIYICVYREQILEDKLSHLQTLVHKSADTCEAGWQALINEDRLLSKLEVLQNQLSAYSKVIS